MTAYELKNIAILSVKADNFRCILWGISRDELKDIDQKSYCSDYYDVSVNKYGIKYRIPLRFWENKGWINNIDPYGWFQWYFRRLEDRTTMKDKFKQVQRQIKLVKMIKDAGSKYDDYSISPKIRQILLHWGYELTEKDFFNELTN